jgi:hypothetical protein
LRFIGWKRDRRTRDTRPVRLEGEQEVGCGDTFLLSKLCDDWVGQERRVGGAERGIGSDDDALGCAVVDNILLRASTVQ